MSGRVVLPPDIARQWREMEKRITTLERRMTRSPDNTVSAAFIEDGTVSDIKLESPNNHIWRPVLFGFRHLVAQNGAENMLVNQTTTTVAAVRYIDPAEFEVEGKTLLFRTDAIAFVNDIDPGIATIDVRLFAVAGTDDTSLVDVVRGADISGSRVDVVANPAANGTYRATAEFEGSVVAANFYVLVVNTSAATSGVDVWAWIEAAWV